MSMLTDDSLFGSRQFTTSALFLGRMSSALRSVPVALLGLGNVGRAVVTSLVTNADLFASKYGVAFDLQAVADSTGVSLDPAAALQAKNAGLSLSSLAGTLSPSAITAAIPPRGILIDCSSSSTTAATLLSYLEGGGSCVLANKKPVSGSYEQYMRLTSPPLGARIRFESTCGAGTPFITSLQRIAAAGDAVSSMQGCFSGTLGFITSQLSPTIKMSQLLSLAMSKGYTEPDPRDDLSTRKARIIMPVSLLTFAEP